MTDYRSDTERLVTMLRGKFPRVRLEDLAGGFFGAVIPLELARGAVDVIVTIDDDCSVDCDVMIGFYDHRDDSIGACEPIDWADSIGRDGDEIVQAILELAAEIDYREHVSKTTRPAWTTRARATGQTAWDPKNGWADR